jgi:hypothetical protein
MSKSDIIAPAAANKGAFSIRAWCEFRDYSVATFYKMKRLGVAPKITELPGSPPRISREADAEWLQAAENLKDDAAKAVQRAAKSRRDRAVAAASKAIKSPAHVSNRRREVA